MSSANTKEDILKNPEKQTVLVPTDFHCKDKKKKKKTFIKYHLYLPQKKSNTVY